LRVLSGLPSSAGSEGTAQVNRLAHPETNASDVYIPAAFHRRTRVATSSKIGISGAAETFLLANWRTNVGRWLCLGFSESIATAIRITR
jgi:hypothetical protein